MSVQLLDDNGIVRVTIDRPDSMNAIDEQTERQLIEIWDSLEPRRDVRVVVLTGAGDRAFCVGADMKGNDPSMSGLEYWAKSRPGGFGGIALRNTLDIPVVARVNGYAVGGGFEMVLGCDLVIAADNAQFGLPEPRVGRMPLDGGMVLLPRIIPEKWAMGMLLTGRRIKASEAYAMGIVNEVAPVGELDEVVDRWVSEIVSCAPLSLRAIKQSHRRTAHLSPIEAQALRLPAVVEALASEDSEEGVRAFREKRPPQWKAR